MYLGTILNKSLVYRMEAKSYIHTSDASIVTADLRLCRHTCGVHGKTQKTRVVLNIGPQSGLCREIWARGQSRWLAPQIQVDESQWWMLNAAIVTKLCRYLRVARVAYQAQGTRAEGEVQIGEAQQGAERRFGRRTQGMDIIGVAFSGLRSCRCVRVTSGRTDMRS